MNNQLQEKSVETIRESSVNKNNVCDTTKISHDGLIKLSSELLAEGLNDDNDDFVNSTHNL